MQGTWRRLYEAHAALPSHQARVAATCTWLWTRLHTATAPYVSFSGGKDSLVVLWMALQFDRALPIFTQGDDLDWPEKRAYCEQVVAALGGTDYEYRLSTVSARAQLREGRARIAGTFSHVVRGYVQDRQRQTVLLGLRSEESRGRRLARATYGPDHVTREGLRHLAPIMDWRGIDVLAFLLAREVPLFSLYLWPDPHIAPHARRMSWPIVPGQLSHGEGVFVKRHAPTLWNRLVREAPHISTEV